MEIFRHIGYAKAERFRPPVLLPLSEGTNTARPSACPQRPFRLGFVMGEREHCALSEDCHDLNIWTPSKEGKHPVLVWIHGGAYVAGTGEEAAYDGAALCEQGEIVVVTISYRLGIFGYLYDAEKGIVNLGLQDQIMALRWVKENIGRFGGDSDLITVAGQSAGGHSVAAILSSCKEPLFRKAIIQSAPLGMKTSRKDGSALLDKVKTIASKPLEELTMDELLEVQGSILSQSRSLMPFSPLEPDFSGKVAIPSLEKVLVTWQKDDASPFVAMKLGHQDRFGSVIDRVATKVASEAVFGAPSKKYAKALRAAGIQTEAICMDWRPEGSPFGACHCLELALLFGSWERWNGVRMLGVTSREEWEKQGRALRSKWIAFIR